MAEILLVGAAAAAGAAYLTYKVGKRAHRAYHSTVEEMSAQQQAMGYYNQPGGYYSQSPPPYYHQSGGYHRSGHSYNYR
ncbi:hypothetical protein I4U23_024663 [Adineta vaga]|nr:hypothetical protein I4U23_024663 [Adineta vaga]